MEENNKHSDIDNLLKKALQEPSRVTHYNLKELFEQRLIFLDITKHQALKILDIDHKILKAILSGDTKKIDALTIVKLSDFLEISREEIANKYFEQIEDNYYEDILRARKRSFIVNNFNLPSLKKIGFINSIIDYEHIESKILDFFGYKTVFEHSKHKITAAFSSGKRTTNRENLSFWYASACQSLENTLNPYEYNRDGLVEYFPQIRWNSLNVENGLLKVSQELFKLGITLIVVPKFTSDLHVRGATLAYNDKPCIVLTNYTTFYGTIWWSLIHELFHVLYDWDLIRAERYHISGETESMRINESEANNFARQYLFSDEKMELVKPYINQPRYVKQFAEKNHIHPSIIYTFYCWDCSDSSIYAKYSKYLNASQFDSLLGKYNAPEFVNFTPILKLTEKRNIEIFNSL